MPVAVRRCASLPAHPPTLSSLATLVAWPLHPTHPPFAGHSPVALRAWRKVCDAGCCPAMRELSFPPTHPILTRYARGLASPSHPPTPLLAALADVARYARSFTTPLLLATLVITVTIAPLWSVLRLGVVLSDTVRFACGGQRLKKSEQARTFLRLSMRPVLVFGACLVLISTLCCARPTVRKTQKKASQPWRASAPALPATARKRAVAGVVNVGGMGQFFRHLDLDKVSF